MSLKASTKRIIARQLMLIASRLLEAGKKERFNEYTSILKKKKFDQDEIDDILKKIDGLQPAKKERVALHWIINDTLELPKDAKKLDKAFDYLELYKKKFEDYDDPDEIIEFGEKSDIERTIVDDFDPDRCPEFSNKQNLGNGIVIYDVEDTWEGMMAVRAAMDTSWGYDEGNWCLATRNHGKMDRAWDYWNNYSAYQKRIAFKNGKVYMFSANDVEDDDNDDYDSDEVFELAWWDKNDKKYNYLPGAFDMDGYELTNYYENIQDDPGITSKDLKILAKHEKKNVRQFVADNPNTPVEALKMLANDEDADVKIYVANNPNTPVETLRKLANDENSYVRRYVAENPSTPVEIVKMLITDKNEQVRREAAANPKTSVEVLNMLANDEDKDIRRGVAENPNTPVETLKMFANDEDKDIRGYVAKNPNLPVETLKMFANDEDEDIRSGVAGNPNTPVEILKKLANDKDMWVRSGVVVNPNTPVEMLKILANDKDYNIRYIAKCRLNRRS